MPRSPDYEASLKKEGGIPDGPVLESLLAGETLDKKVETKEEEPMSECQVGLSQFLSLCSALCCSLCLVFVVSFLCVRLSISFYLSVSPSVFVFLCLSLPLSLSVLAVTRAPVALTTSSWHRMCACLWLCVIALQPVGVLQWFQSHDLQTNLVNNTFEGHLREVSPPLCSLSPFIQHVALSSSEQCQSDWCMSAMYEAVSLEFRWTANQSAVEWMAFSFE